MIVDEQAMEIPPKDEEELELERLVFGDLEGFEKGLRDVDFFGRDETEADSGNEPEGDDVSEDDDFEKLQDDQLFFVDESKGDVGVDYHGESGSEDNTDYSEEESDAWEDSDDQNLRISVVKDDKLEKLRKRENESVLSGKSYIFRLKSQFEKIHPRPDWADESDSEDSDGTASQEENELVKSNMLLDILSKQYQVASKTTKLLPPTNIDIDRLRDANAQRVAHSSIKTIAFHPTHPLLATGGMDRTIRIFQLDGKVNNFITSIHLKQSSILSLEFQDDKLFAGGSRPYMYKWNLQNERVEKINKLYGNEKTQKSFGHFKLSCDGRYIGLAGNSGWVNVLSTTNGLWLRGFKIEDEVVDIDFMKQSDDNILIAVNSAGEVWEWNVDTGKFLNKWSDDSGTGITQIKACDRWLAVGNNVGIVNIYDRRKLTNSTTRPKPIGTVENLVTAITALDFTPDGQVLCVTSNAVSDGLRLVHLPSCTVFRNWPTRTTPLGTVTTVKFSPRGETLCVGNTAGKVRMWRLNHY
ncbi:Small subunit (SSU) processome component [Komagataella phaffii CBS 7435]|uniref:U3 snoRNP protein n=2 Tax=Komagataella phaffii TaxID=460519 RepID=C4R126_KOMPG|nr:uncharacterized protein PAS_chr2-1_0863 [Komagataella phaffii GS115]AOA62107.1 GQ67_00620T0 [Komagataella phaffii]CAH2448275.1 Small subunit (SSU) processome component [Komagataella phaffii CBS 7435]AOA67022.1 GQ68_00768T0 [Komagataella phaffii GS115]CAY69200.1 hypothetical protein PAS_chr2-1_0863 [Komagataella phaffii GS115]SCV12052.1 Small subunit (SSU) processome component [Komagataella phaffii CBS 7435]